MRKQLKEGVTIEYPDEIGFVFNRSYIHVEGSAVEIKAVTVTIGEGKVKYLAFNNSAMGDYSELVAFAFGDIVYQPEYYKNTTTEIGKRLETVINIETDEGVVGFSWTTFYLWGVMKQGERYNEQKNLNIFYGYPFTASVYVSGARSLFVLPDGNHDNKQEVVIEQEGVYNFDLSVYGAKKFVQIVDIDGRGNVTTFDETFDYTFGSITATVLVNAVYNYCFYEKPVYMRWVNRHGNVNYWLFKMVEEDVDVTSGNEVRNDLGKWASSAGWAGTYGRRRTHERKEYVTLYTSLVDDETYRFLMDITSSPLVDMWNEESNKWQSVCISDGDYQRSLKYELNDFVIKLELEPTKIQRL